MARKPTFSFPQLSFGGRGTDRDSQLQGVTLRPFSRFLQLAGPSLGT